MYTQTCMGLRCASLPQCNVQCISTHRDAIAHWREGRSQMLNGKSHLTKSHFECGFHPLWMTNTPQYQSVPLVCGNAERIFTIQRWQLLCTSWPKNSKSPLVIKLFLLCYCGLWLYLYIYIQLQVLYVCVVLVNFCSFTFHIQKRLTKECASECLHMSFTIKTTITLKKQVNLIMQAMCVD